MNIKAKILNNNNKIYTYGMQKFLARDPTHTKAAPWPTEVTMLDT